MSKQLSYQQVTTGITYPVGDLYGYPDSLIRGRTAAAYEHAINLLPFNKNSYILDFGSGRGHGMVVIQQKLSPKRLFSLDKETSYINIAQQPLHAESDNEFIVADNLSAFKNESLDVIFCMHVLEHLTNPELIFTDFQRTLKKGGYLIIATPDKPHLVGKSPYDEHVFTQTELEGLFKKAGFLSLNFKYINADKNAWRVHSRKRLLAKKYPWTVHIRDKIPFIWEALVLRLGKTANQLSAANFYLSDTYTDNTIDILVIASK